MYYPTEQASNDRWDVFLLLPHLFVFFWYVLLGIFGKLDHLRHDVWFFVTVGEVHKHRGCWVKDIFVCFLFKKQNQIRMKENWKLCLVLSVDNIDNLLWIVFSRQTIDIKTLNCLHVWFILLLYQINRNVNYMGTKLAWNILLIS